MNETQIDNLVIEITSDSSGASSSIDELAKSLNRLSKAASGGTTKKLRRLSTAIKGLLSTSVISKAISEANKYVENVNLFTVAMGQYADSAMEYAKRVESVMGIDSSEFMRNQAIFKNMADGFGMAEDKAVALSQGLTELAYDISSLYNESLTVVFQRLQSGLAGEIEPVRRWGIALDQASMKQWMLKKGLDANVASLTQADKALVRYNMIVEAMRDNNAIGDLARTIETPANAIRVFNQRVTQMYRAIGTLLIPILNKALPYVQAFVMAITQAAQALANFFGIDIDFSVSFENAAAGVADSMEDAAGSAKKLKDYTMGFDELNIINPSNAAAGATVGGSVLSGLDVQSVWDENVFALVKAQADELVGKMKVLLGLVTAIGVAFAAWKIGSAIAGGITAFKLLNSKIAEAVTKVPLLSSAFNALKAIPKGPLALILLAVAAISLALIDLWRNSETFRDKVKEVMDEVKFAFEGLKKAVWDFIVNPVIEGLGITATSFKDLYEKHIRPIVEKIAIVLVDILGAAIVSVIDFFTGLVVGVGLANEAISGKIQELAANGAERIEEMKTNFRVKFDEIKRNTLARITELKDGLFKLWGIMMTEVTDFKNQFTDMFEQIRRNVTEKIQSMINFFGDLISKIKKAIRTVKEFFEADTQMTIGTETNSGKQIGVSVGKYASGGFLEDGLFTMNHGEIAGKFSNGQSVVANNQQIVDGISDGVYRAVMAAQAEESDKPVQVSVYLDGKQISKSVDKYNNSRGRVIMGNGLGYNF